MTRSPAGRVLLLMVMALVFTGALSSVASAKPKAPGKLNTKVAEPQVFRYKFKAGTKQAYKSKVSQAMEMASQAGPGMLPPGGVKTTINATLINSVDKVLPSGDAQLVTTYDKLTLNLNQGGQEVPSEMLAPQVDMLKKIRSTSTLSPMGEKSDLKIENAPGGQQQGGPLQDAMVGAAIVFPAKGVKVGESWKQKIPLEMKQGPMTLKFSFTVDYTFMGYKKQGARRLAVFKSDIYMLLLDQKGGMPGHDISMKGSGKGTGYLYFDQKEGVIIKSDMEMLQEINTTMSAQGQAPQTMDMKITTEALMELTKTK